MSKQKYIDPVIQKLRRNDEDPNEAPFLHKVLGLPPANDDALNLIDALLHCHYKANMVNRNIGREVFLESYEESGSIMKATGSMIGVMGSRHAPLEEARRVQEALLLGENIPRLMIKKFGGGQQELIAGYGNSFFKDRVDPSFGLVLDVIDACGLLIPDSITIAKENKESAKLYINAAGITGFVCEVLGLSEGSEVLLPLMARLSSNIEILAIKNDIKKQSKLNKSI